MTRLTALRKKIRDLHLSDEQDCINTLIKTADLSSAMRTQTVARASGIVKAIRAEKSPGMMEVFLAEYGLSTTEGVALMCLAEALLRVPDAKTMDDLIEDKLSAKSWNSHIGHSDSSLVNASTWALMLTGKVLNTKEEDDISSSMGRLVKRMGEPVIRRAVKAAMKEMGNQFVLGQTIQEAVKRGEKRQAQGYTHSYDMLGEAALTDRDAQSFVRSYADAIGYLATQCDNHDVRQNPGISIKLSALHPRYELTQKQQVMDVLVKRTLKLTLQARSANMGLNIDAEEADRLDLSLDIIEAVLSDPRLTGWDGFGVVVQAYSKRAPAVLDWLHALAEKLDRKIMVRLVKGAYWDTEIKRAQIDGLPGFPVFTKKTATDISYIGCARKLLGYNTRIYPQFATHNAHSVQTIMDMANADNSYEFQRLHGMGGGLYDQIIGQNNTRCRIYAPVGVHEDLLAYLVRRLLENGANSSFVNQIVDKDIPAAEVVSDPYYDWDIVKDQPSPGVHKPSDLYQPERVNSIGFDLTNVTDLARMKTARDGFLNTQWTVFAQLSKGTATGESHAILNPADPNDIVGHVTLASVADTQAAIQNAAPWDAPQRERAKVLNRAADLYEENFAELFAILCREAGKTLMDAISELREAVDFMRYYAAQSAHHSDSTPRGVFACISPWNFPLAIFSGQISAALSVGNAVLAKPAEPTPIIATRAVELLYQAGVPRTALQLLIGSGREVGALIVADPNVGGTCFTGSTATAQHINRSVAQTGLVTAPLIAETGGLNAMIVDSTALPEQAVRDIVASAFQSAGQRCSALRMLYLQEDIAPKFLEMLYGAMDAQVAGNPWDVATDIGPVITQVALDGINAHIETATREGRVLHQTDVPKTGTFAKPTAIKVTGIEALTKEIFGPVLHVATYKAKHLDQVVEAINASQYGLTFGVHSRIDTFVNKLCNRLNVGNIYVNRNQIGAVVGSQPFGGEGLSGTGPKAGGPDYLKRFVMPEPAMGQPYTADTLDIGQVQSLIDDCKRPQRAALHTSILPGPTGELNQLSTYGRGVVLCLGPSLEQAKTQAKHAQKSGCATVITGAMPLEYLENLQGFDAVVLWADETALRTARLALAKRKGALLPLIDARDITERCTIERHICIDTTAAGGNAALLAADS
ncbi:MAG: bifunctional proline dehydrogenase/L-glutamate gamma-semialdehyde dehydrogenase PutA [Amylibacter sp.]|nr:bifunctional proline dehydrogenase/L-glutamate gamma-semialdehyde dehydrogenase PutA [Amylibacter sp.]